MTKKILVVEDDNHIADLICRYLQRENFLCERVNCGDIAISVFDQVKPDLVVLDLMLPKMGGNEVCDKIRAISTVPIIMVSALSAEESRLEGFARGADDYLCKPFNPRELVARVKAIFRRCGPDSESGNAITHGALHVDFDERVVKVNGVDVEFTQTEFNLLGILISDPSRVFSREQLLDGAHESFADCYARSVDFHVKNIRRKVNVTDTMNYIKSVYGVGYKFV